MKSYSTHHVLIKLLTGKLPNVEESSTMTENKILKIEIFYLMPLLGESKSKNQILVEHNELLNQKNQNIEHLTKAEKMEDEKQREIINKIRYPHKQSTYRSISTVRWLVWRLFVSVTQPQTKMSLDSKVDVHVNKTTTENIVKDQVKNSTSVYNGGSDGKWTIVKKRKQWTFENCQESLSWFQSNLRWLSCSGRCMKAMDLCYSDVHKEVSELNIKDFLKEVDNSEQIVVKKLDTIC